MRDLMSAECSFPIYPQLNPRLATFWGIYEGGSYDDQHKGLWWGERAHLASVIKRGHHIVKQLGYSLLRDCSRVCRHVISHHPRGCLQSLRSVVSLVRTPDERYFWRMILLTTGLIEYVTNDPSRKGGIWSMHHLMRHSCGDLRELVALQIQS